MLLAYVVVVKPHVPYIALLFASLLVSASTNSETGRSCRKTALAMAELPTRPHASFLQHGAHLKIGMDTVVEGHIRQKELQSPQGGGEPTIELRSVLSSLSYLSNQRFLKPEGANATSAIRAITFITIQDSFFATNLGTSFLWHQRASLPHEWLLLNNTQSFAISELYARAQAGATHDLLVFLHSDVILPDDWYQNFMDKLTKIEAIDPNWGVLGTAGVPEGWVVGERPDHEKIVSSLTDCFRAYTNGVDSLPVQSLDESLLVLNRKISPGFDNNLPGLDLYGMDVCMAARKLGYRSYLLNVHILHKIMDADGQPYHRENFMAKIWSPDYEERVSKTTHYMQRKWCNSGYLPVFGTSYTVQQPSLPCQ
jgi:hypothetical protein